MANADGGDHPDTGPIEVLGKLRKLPHALAHRAVRETTMPLEKRPESRQCRLGPCITG
jgi:hypothetical protein